MPALPFCTLPGSPEASLGKHWAVRGACRPTWALATPGPPPRLCVDREGASAWPTLPRGELVLRRGGCLPPPAVTLPRSAQGSGSGVGRCWAPEPPGQAVPLSLCPSRLGESQGSPRHLPTAALPGVDVGCLWETGGLEQWADGCWGRRCGGEPWPLVDGRFRQAGAGGGRMGWGGDAPSGFSPSPPPSLPRQAFQRRAFCLFLLRSR